MEVFFLPVDLGRWDESARGDLLAVPVWSDVRPLRAAAGLVDWRLCGKLSDCLRDRRFSGAEGEKLLLPTHRFPWPTVLVLGVGSSGEFSEERCRTALAAILGTARGLSKTALALALPGRDIGRLDPERALALLLAIAEKEAPPSMQITVIDSPAALKTMGALASPAPPPPRVLSPSATRSGI